MRPDEEVWQALMGGDARTLAAALGLTVAVGHQVEKLDARPVPPGGVIGVRKGNLTRTVEVGK